MTAKKTAPNSNQSNPRSGPAPGMDKRFKPTRFHGPITQEFLDQAKTYSFRFLCEDCTYFDEETELCLHAYPNEPHRKRYFAEDPLHKRLIFCREFDIN